MKIFTFEIFVECGSLLPLLELAPALQRSLLPQAMAIQK
jgi:hypothetical protein